MTVNIKDVTVTGRIHASAPDPRPLWTPASTTNVMWLDSSAASTITITGGATPGRVSTWRDATGNGQEMYGAGTFRNPFYVANAINGLPAMGFQGNQNFLSGGSNLQINTTDWAAFVVGKNTNTTSHATYFAKSVAQPNPPDTWKRGRYGITRWSGTSLGAEFSAENGLSGIPTPTWTSTDWAILSQAVKRNVSHTLYIDGAQAATISIAGTGTTNLTNTTRFLVGAHSDPTDYQQPGSDYYYLTGNIAEVILTRDASDSNRQNIEGYLAHKYGLTANLPANHPYKSAPPRG